MARLRASESVEGDEQSTILSNHRGNSSRQNSQAPRAQHASKSPSLSDLSDKENSEQQAHTKTPMGPPPLPQTRSAGQNGNKRRRVDQVAAPPSRSRSSSVMSEAQQFDPHQDIEERRRLRKELRDLNNDANQMRQEWMAPDSTGLQDALTHANSLFRSVKQTSDATIDSRLLVTAGDMTYKKTQQVSVGDGSQGIDVDEFVSKVIGFMRLGDEENMSSTFRRNRRTATERGSDDEGDGTQDDGDALNWEYLGSQACFPANSRPPVPGFLLGPLSVSRRQRAQTQRRERQARIDPQNATRPQELRSEDFQKQENSNLTHTCKKIHKQLGSTIRRGTRRVEQEVDLDSTTDNEINEILEKNDLCDDGGVSLFKFAINPHSFGQSVENLFYVSFLIRDGLIGVQKDGKQMPTLHYREPPSENPQQQETEERGRRDAKRNQAVFSLDFETWKELVEVLKIQNSLIPDRSDVEASTQNVSSTGWYG